MLPLQMLTQLRNKNKVIYKSLNDVYSIIQGKSMQKILVNMNGMANFNGERADYVGLMIFSRKKCGPG